VNASPLEAVRGPLEQAIALYGADLAVVAKLDALRTRIDEPLRVVFVGTVKSGKSTLLNALLGEQVAPTDARECTRIVTWYRHGKSPGVRAHHVVDGNIPIPMRRQDQRLELDLDHLDADEIEWLDVTWPASPLEEFTLIDTPGTASISTAISERTQEFIAPGGGMSGADAVVYLLRSLHAHDVDFLRNLSERSGGESSMGAIAVLSRADEMGSGRLNSMAIVNKAVDRLREDPTLEAACETIVPVAGLLALAGQTLRQSEFVQLAEIAKLPEADLATVMVSADRFITADVDGVPTPQVRDQLMRRLGLFGVRLAVAMIRIGTDDATTLSQELVKHSGLEELQRVIDVHFRRRHPQLKAHAILLGLHQVLTDHPNPHAAELLEAIEEQLADSHPFREMKLLGRVNSSRLILSLDDRRELERLLGGSGVSPEERLGAGPADDLLPLAAVALRKWRDMAANPLLDPDTAEASRLAARSCEGIVADLVDVQF